MDEWGEVIRAENYVQAMDLAPDGPDASADGLETDAGLSVRVSIDEVLQEREDVPTKVVHEQLQVDINCQVCVGRRGRRRRRRGGRCVASR